MQQLGMVRVKGMVRTEGIIGMVVIPILVLLLLWIVSFFGRTMPFTLFGLSICFFIVIISLVLDEVYQRGPLTDDELQNRFWGYLMTGFLCVLFYSPDSPIGSFGSEHPILAIFVSIFVGGLGFLLDRYISKNRRKILNPLSINKTTRELPPLEVNSAKELHNTIEMLLKKLDINPALKLMQRTFILQTQSTILEALRTSNRIALNFVLLETNLQTLFYKVKDTDVTVRHGPNNNYRTQLIELLCTNPNQKLGGRLDELDIRSRALVIATLQESNLLAFESIEKMVVNMIRHTRGSNLTTLKMLLDDRCSVHSLHKLVWHDILNQEYRLQIIDHLDQQGGLRKYMWKEVAEKALERNIDSRSMMNETLKKYSLSRTIHRKILSDVDDTFFSSGGRFPAGCDNSYPRHELYPGVLSMYRELDITHGLKNKSNRNNNTTTSTTTHLHQHANNQNSNNSSSKKPTLSSNWIKSSSSSSSSSKNRNSSNKREPGNLTFLSARPHVYRDVVEKSAFKRFRQLIALGELHCAPTMLAGSLGTGGSMFWGDYGPMSQQKFTNFVQFTTLWPECTFLFIGDNGQGDVRVGELIIENYSHRTDGVFIHLIQPIEDTPGYIKGISEQKWKEQKIYFFTTYIGLAVEALRRGLINDDALEKISRSAKEEFQSIDFSNPTMYQKAFDDINRDLTEANDMLHVVRGVHGFTTSRRRASRGWNEKKRGRRVSMLNSTNGHHGNNGSGGSGNGGYGGNGGNGGNGVQDDDNESNTSGRGSTDIYVPFLRPKISMVFHVNDRVITCFGIGIIEQKARPKDGIYTVLLGDDIHTSNVMHHSTNSATASSRYQHGNRNGVRVYAPASALRRVAPLPRGTPVLTTFGTGIVYNVQPKHNIHEIWLKTVATSSSITKAYLNKRDVLKPLRAAVGDRVKTIMGIGLVVGYRKHDNFYCIKLGKGKEDSEFFATLYTKDKLERLEEEKNGDAFCLMQ